MVELEPLFEPLPRGERELPVVLGYFLLTPLDELNAQCMAWSVNDKALAYTPGKPLTDDALQMRCAIEELQAWTEQRGIAAVDFQSQYPDEELKDFILLHPDPTPDEQKIIDHIIKKGLTKMIFPEICYMIPLFSLSQRDNGTKNPLMVAASTAGMLVSDRLNKGEFTPRERLRAVSAMRMALSKQETYAKARDCDGFEELAIKDRALRGLRAKDILLKSLCL